MLKIKKLNDLAILPKRANLQDSGLDLYSIEEVIIYPNESKLIPTGWAMEVPLYFEIQIRPRSGLAIKNSITVGNAPGTIDSIFRGEVKVILRNEGKESFLVKYGDKIAQAVVCPVCLWNPVVVDELSETNRGAGGFGSTGNK